MPTNANISFYLSRGNPFNNPCGMSEDQNIFGNSIGGKIFLKETFLTGQTINCNNNNVSNALFDSIVATDIIKNNLNYRAIYVVNSGVADIVLDNITIGMVNNNSGFYFCDVDVAIEGLYTIGEVTRPIPNINKTSPQNPSLYLNDEYDSTNILSTLTFKKILSSTDLPSELPSNTVLKLWIRRETVIDKIQMPDGYYVESFILNINEYDTSISTPIEVKYEKKEGRISLANWYDYTITSGTGTKVVLKELFAKDVDLSTINVIKTFVKENNILIYYYTENQTVKNYFLLVIAPNDISSHNKYIQINLNLFDNVQSIEYIISKDILDIYKSFYNPDIYFIFWKESIHTTDTAFLGAQNTYDRITVDTLNTTIWSNNTAFTNLPLGYDNRKIVQYNIVENKIIRNYTKGINLEQFDDLFILFTEDTKNSQILNIKNIFLNRNQLIYVFEKDIISYKYNKFNSYNGDGAQLLSHRLYPPTMAKDQRAISFNNVKNTTNSVIFSDPLIINSNTESLRTIKSLLDGTRYIDFNSIHTKEFNVKNNFITYELPLEQITLNNLIVTSSISIDNDTNIYNSKKEHVITNNIINNIVDGYIFDRPWFQRNIIDDSKVDSLSIPLEWADRNYKDEWITITSTLPISSISNFSVKYNFNRNLWKAVYYNSTNESVDIIYDPFNKLYYSSTIGTTGVGTTGTSGIPEGKLYSNITIPDMTYILEPGTYQPFSVKVSTVANNNNYLVNYKFYFKGNINPIFDISTTVADITNISYILLNPDKAFNMKINYLDVANANSIPIKYIVKNIHNMFLNKIDIEIGSERSVNKQLFPNQSNFVYYRKINITGIDNTSTESSKEIVIPIILYGNSYKPSKIELYSNSLSLAEFNALSLEDLNSLKLTQNYRLNISNPFDFTKVDINDKNIRLYYDTGLSNPLNLRIEKYDYQKDYVILWVKLPEYNSESKQLMMFYGNTEINSNKQEYLTLKNNLYTNVKNLGVWFFDKIIYDERLSGNVGKIFNIGEPLIYEKTINNDIRLTKIDKEYMYGIAKVYKSHKFNIDLEVPAEESLFFTESVKTQFINFITDTASLLKPSYTQINKIKQYGIDVLESGQTVGDSMGQTTNQRVSGLIAMTPNSNVMTYYDRLDDNRFNLLTSFNGFSKEIDWVVAKTIDTRLFKAGTLKINGKLKSETIKFETPFKDSDYFVFLKNPVNQNIYWQLICNNRFTISASHYLSKEVSWMAFHRDMFGGVYTTNSMFMGKRIITGSIETTEGESPTTANLPSWYNNELIIKPEIAVDGDPGMMDISPLNPGYSLILSSNENINLYWNLKTNVQFNVKTSAPIPCTVHWLVIKKGVEWWNELT